LILPGLGGDLGLVLKPGCDFECCPEDMMETS
jgi:hypothetical protein